ncbi:MAG: sulfur reduction protein DsrS [Gammaproteobacteria bacterium]|nr:sulfur reduction protein DsrS [Gammaproteobacteria bacterium]
MELSAEDNLRLNVLLAQKLQAVRIDESKMTVHALTDKGEAKVVLNPNCKDEKYLKEVKELLSTHVTGSPGGYPVFISRWTRMGQARDESLQQLLLLGESEAVVAAVHAPGLTDELAERAWWAMPTADNARRMLEKEAVVQGKTGAVLAEFLIEFLPFEEDPHVMIDSVRLVLQPGLISEEEKQKLWIKAKNKRNFYVGFLHAVPDALPVDAQSHASYQSVIEKIQLLIDEGNPYAIMLSRILSAQGQAFVQTAQLALKKPSNQEVVESLLNAIAAYFRSIKPKTYTTDNIEVICDEAGCKCNASEDAALKAVLDVVPEMKEMIRAMLVLSCLSVALINPVFSQTDAIGTMMRKKIKHITDPVLDQLSILTGK